MSICLLFFLCSCSEFYCIWHLNDNISYTFKSLKFFKRVHINSYMLGGQGNHRDKLASTNLKIDTFVFYVNIIAELLVVLWVWFQKSTKETTLTFCCIKELILTFYVYALRGRHASNFTEEEEDEEYLKGEEDGLANTRLVTQPSCKCSFFLCMLSWIWRLYFKHLTLCSCTTKSSPFVFNMPMH